MGSRPHPLTGSEQGRALAFPVSPELGEKFSFFASILFLVEIPITFPSDKSSRICLDQVPFVRVKFFARNIFPHAIAITEDDRPPVTGRTVPEPALPMGFLDQTPQSPGPVPIKSHLVGQPLAGEHHAVIVPSRVAVRVDLSIGLRDLERATTGTGGETTTFGFS